MKKIIAIFLVLLLTLPYLYACNDQSTLEQSQVQNHSQTTSRVEENKFPLEEKKFDATVKILTRPLRYAQQFAPLEEFEGSAINAAVEARNQLIEENYGITIEMHATDSPRSEEHTSELQSR